jgi:Zn-dependent protease with chaperone function
LPSKEVFVYAGLLDTLPDDDALLAAVLGHEIAHVMERHSVENLGVSYGNQRVLSQADILASF